MVFDAFLFLVLEGYGKDYCAGAEFNEKKFYEILEDFKKYEEVFPKTTNDLPKRNMKDSFQCAILDFEDVALSKVIDTDENSSTEGTNKPLTLSACHRKICSFYDIYSGTESLRHLTTMK